MHTSLESLCELYEDGPCGLLFVDGAGRLVHVNRTLLAWTGYSDAELRQGSPYSLLLTVPGALLFQTHCIPLLRLRGVISEISLDLRCKDGRQMPVLLAASVKKDDAGKESLVRVMFASAPNRREYERELLRARTQAEDAADKLRRMTEQAQRKVAEQEVLLASVAQMTSGDLDTPVSMDSESSLFPLASALDRMRKDILEQLRKLQEHTAEVQQLNKELRRQIEQRSRLLVASMESDLARSDSFDSEETSTETQPILARGVVLADRYLIGDILGQGGMGTVYEVVRLSDGKHFAAKVLGDKPSYRAMARFAREAQLLARINHPNLIDILDVDITEDRVAYIIMELVRGKSLAELTHRYGERDLMLRILLQTAQALTAVHAAGAVHRDLMLAARSSRIGDLPTRGELAAKTK
jgi:PAS domain S-box-containing protein